MTRGLLHHALDYLADTKDPIVHTFLCDIGGEPDRRVLEPRGVPVAGRLAVALGRAREPEATVLRALVEEADRLHWGQTYSAAEMGERFIAEYGWVELLGPRGHFFHPSIACGILMLGPHVVYPDHRHRAEEIYVPLTGGSRWRRGAEPFRFRRAGEVVFHESMTPHAMATADAPLLALYMWRGGNLAQKSLFDHNPIPEDVSNG